MEAERDATFQGFEESVKDIQETTELGNTFVQQRLQNAMDQEVEADAQVMQITAAAKLDTREVADVERSITEALSTRNSMSEDLSYQLVRARKGFNDCSTPTGRPC